MKEPDPKGIRDKCIICDTSIGNKSFMFEVKNGKRIWICHAYCWWKIYCG